MDDEIAFKPGDRVLRNPKSKAWIGKKPLQQGLFAVIGTVIEYSYSVTRDFDEILYVRVQWSDGNKYAYEVDSDELLITEDPSNILKDIL